MDNTAGMGAAMESSAQRSEIKALKERVERLEFQIRERTTLRDQMAIAAMAGMAANMDFLRGLQTAFPDLPADHAVALAAYEQADEMLKVRKDG